MLWVLVTIPIFLVLLVFTVDIANIWLARVELENGLEAAALAAVKEWGDAGGGETLIPRLVGVDFAHANTIRCHRIGIGTNYAPDAGETNPNQNLSCCLTPGDPAQGIPPEGNLIFGAVSIDEEAECPIVFNAGEVPSCGIGTVLFDASAQGQGGKPISDDNWWGVSFFRTDDTPDELRISKIIIDLRASGGVGYFSSAGDLSDNVPAHKVRCAGKGKKDDGVEQPDISGFTDISDTGQIQFSFLDPPTNSKLLIEFFPDTDPAGGTDDGFAPCDRFRFGINLEDVGIDGQGNRHNDGDGVGFDRVGVEVFFEIGGVEQGSATGFFTDTSYRSHDCCEDGLPYIEPTCGSLVVHPAGIKDLPCPPSSSVEQDGQSFGWVRGAGGTQDIFAVHAQATIGVNSLFRRICGFPMGPYCVTAQTTAIYDCEERRPRLTRLDKFICPGP